MKKFLSAALITSALVPLAFANSNAGSKVYISTTSVGDTVMAQGDFEALTFTEIKSVGNLGETGSKTNILNYDTWDDAVIQKSKGLTDAGSPTLEVARRVSDAGQILARAAAETNLNYAFKIVRNDPSYVGGVGTVIYQRGLISGPTNPNGKNEDFDLDVYQLAFQQKEVRVNPGAGGVAPEFTAAPAITGTIEVGEIATCSTGTATGDAVITYAYQWFAGGVAITGATANTFTITSTQLGKKLQCRVVASNASGTAQSWSNLTAAVAP
jgi:hypothetical protein